MQAKRQRTDDGLVYLHLVLNFVQSIQEREEPVGVTVVCVDLRRQVNEAVQVRRSLSATPAPDA